MPFEARSVMSQKEEFVRLALAPGANVSALCRRFGIGRTCGHKLIARFRAEGVAGLTERSRRPKSSPRRSPPVLEAAVVSLRRECPAWGGRKIAGVLERDGIGAIAPSTVTGILRRNGVELGALGGGAQPFIRFEHEAPNDLWQMDFKGHVPLRQGRLHPLTVLDDHSRFSLALEACPDQTNETVKARLITAFRRYGLPWRIAIDNGPPWGDGGRNNFTVLGVWLIEMDVAHQPCQALPSPDAGQGGALPSLAQGRGAAGTALRKPPARPECLRQLAPSLQSCFITPICLCC
ncbi:transposase [Mesorhizobium shonense]|uniref:Transposase n=1 Tax=Mesorhizobium shonense TaxID=1209948 RepID=A0ABV2I4Y4_9HYPH